MNFDPHPQPPPGRRGLTDAGASPLHPFDREERQFCTLLAGMECGESYPSWFQYLRSSERYWTA